MLFLRKKRDNKGVVWGIIGAPAFLILIIAILISGIIILAIDRGDVNLTSLEYNVDYKYMVDFFSKTVKIRTDLKVDPFAEAQVMKEGKEAVWEDMEMIYFVDLWYHNQDKYEYQLKYHVFKFLDTVPNQDFRNLYIYHKDEEVWKYVIETHGVWPKDPEFSIMVPLQDDTILDFRTYRHKGLFGHE